MNIRLKELRKILNVSQRQFCAKLCISQSLYGLMEVGSRVITERTLKSICREYNVNEEWLRTGKGEIFNTFEDNRLMDLVIEYNLDKLGTSLLKIALSLNEEEKEVIYQLAKKIIDDVD